MGDICKTLGDSHVATEIFELWKEYEDGLTPEALLVKVGNVCKVLYR